MWPWWSHLDHASQSKVEIESKVCVSAKNALTQLYFGMYAICKSEIGFGPLFLLKLKANTFSVHLYTHRATSINRSFECPIQVEVIRNISIKNFSGKGWTLWLESAKK